MRHRARSRRGIATSEESAVELTEPRCLHRAGRHLASAEGGVRPLQAQWRRAVAPQVDFSSTRCERFLRAPRLRARTRRCSARWLSETLENFIGGDALPCPELAF